MPSPINPSSDQTLVLLRAFNSNNVSRITSLHRLATAQRINSASDDPAGLISSESLRAALASLDAESRASVRADHVVSTADGALGEISDLLNDAEALAVANANTGGLSEAEREANQMELDSINASIDRIASTTTFNGEQLLDGSLSISLDGATLDVDSVAARELGAIEIDGEFFDLADTQSGGALNIVDGDPEAAQQAIGAARQQVATLRGKLGAFSANVIQPKLNTIGVAMENISAAESLIRDTDYAFETAALVRSDVIGQAQLSALGSLFDSRSQILDLLG